MAIAEDDLPLRGLLTRGLREEGFDITLSVPTARELLTGVEAGPPDLLVVDIGLPDADGRDVVMALRARCVHVPVLLITARDRLHDLLAGFRAGADDYLVKPFAFQELIVRLHALARRAVPAAPGEGGLRLDPARHCATDGERVVDLTPIEFRLLAPLLARPGEVVRRHALIAAAWPDGAIVHDNTLDSYITRLRRKLAGLNGEASITAARGIGYRFS
ncbi:response regulator transcription factor [Sphaerisporangium sp. NPDC049002]|uniref:response regulator transcription factor n=1 Tax=unclassified Sphaerisporangium TaxID=2630420 RepID=UPI0033F57729